jgi:hypothetical protein
MMIYCPVVVTLSLPLVRNLSKHEETVVGKLNAKVEQNKTGGEMKE